MFLDINVVSKNESFQALECSMTFVLISNSISQKNKGWNMLDIESFFQQLLPVNINHSKVCIWNGSWQILKSWLKVLAIDTVDIIEEQEPWLSWVDIIS